MTTSMKRWRCFRRWTVAAVLAATVAVVPLASGASIVSIVEYPVPTPAAGLVNIALGPDGNLWFAESNASKIGRITPSGAVTEYELPTPNARPFDIAAGTDGNLWFTEMVGNKIGKITPAGVITEFELPSAGAGPHGIVVALDGSVWFTEINATRIGRLTPATGAIDEYELPTPASTYRIAADADGNLWFTENGRNKLGKITPATGAIVEYELPTPFAGPAGITAGSDGNIWFTEVNANKIGRITPATGAIEEYELPTAGAIPLEIAAGPDGNLWFTENAANRIGRITPSGAVTEFVVPTAGAGPSGIAADGDGNLWFTENVANQIGKATLAATLPSTLVVVSDVVNDEGGTAVPSDWTMTVTGPDRVPASFRGAGSPGTTMPLAPGAYAVSASGPVGYSTIAGADCTGMIAAGETKTCTIGNDDEAAPPPSGPCIVLSETTVDVPGIAATPAQSRVTRHEGLTVTNCGTTDVNVEARATDATGSSGTWQLTEYPRGSPIENLCELGPDLFSAAFGLTARGNGEEGGVYLTTLDQVLVDPADEVTPFVFPAAAVADAWLQVAMPCVGSVGLGDPMNMDITLTATAP